MPDNQDTKQQIRVVAELLGLDDFVIEKDLYVTKAISIVTNISNEYYEVVFQGGTSLAKAHRIIERMSEDCDFRFRLKESTKKLGSDSKREILRSFRSELVEALKENGFNIDNRFVEARNEGRFMSVNTYYPTNYPTTQGIKPYLALEFFETDVKIQSEIKPVTTLIKQILGDKVEHTEFDVNTVAIIETAAEKWVALTRRVALSSHKEHPKDANLVRHIYDLHRIQELGYFSNEFNSLILPITLEDREKYKNQNDDYFRNPVSEIKRAIDELHKLDKWSEYWEIFLESMVFSDKVPTFTEALENIYTITQQALKELEKINFRS
jgi:predicted nucleotidyltransferase component of viral defense system